MGNNKTKLKLVFLCLSSPGFTPSCYVILTSVPFTLRKIGCKFFVLIFFSFSENTIVRRVPFSFFFFQHSLQKEVALKADRHFVKSACIKLKPIVVLVAYTLRAIVCFERKWFSEIQNIRGLLS